MATFLDFFWISSHLYLRLFFFFFWFGPIFNIFAKENCAIVPLSCKIRFPSQSCRTNYNLLKYDWLKLLIWVPLPSKWMFRQGDAGHLWPSVPFVTTLLSLSNGQKVYSLTIVGWSVYLIMFKSSIRGQGDPIMLECEWRVNKGIPLKSPISPFHVHRPQTCCMTLKWL